MSSLIRLCAALAAPAVITAFMFAAGPARAGDAPMPNYEGHGDFDIGPAVGSAVPQPFTALDASGAAKTLPDLMGEKGLVLAFVRSADWCPYCKQQMIDLNGIVGELDQHGYKLAAISYDAPPVLAMFTARSKLDYTLLSDTNSAMIDAFGIRETDLYKPGSRAWGVPKPVIFVIDKDGVIRAKLAEEKYQSRPAPELVVEAVEGVE